jgi:hypothetical protein
MKIASPYAIRFIHVGEWFVCEEHGSCESFRNLEQRGRELEQLNLKNNPVDTAAPFFTDSKTSHERGQFFVARFGRSVHESVSIHQWFSRIGDFDTVFENFHHGTGSGHKEILMNKCVGNQFPYRQFRKYGYCSP